MTAWTKPLHPSRWALLLCLFLGHSEREIPALRVTVCDRCGSERG